ncbi:MAG: polysulfide reductase NrfD [Firmicutes bacterium]|nr:polysulfide reductase NrfD [Bacillota bacterium]
MKLVTLNSIICTAFIITAAQVHGLLYNSFSAEYSTLTASFLSLLMLSSGISMISAIYIYQIIAMAKNHFIRANNFIFVLMIISFIMTIYPLLNTIFDIRMIDKIYQITRLYIFSDTPSMYISLLFVFLFLAQLYVQFQKDVYDENYPKN